MASDDPAHCKDLQANLGCHTCMTKTLMSNADHLWVVSLHTHQVQGVLCHNCSPQTSDRCRYLGDNMQHHSVQGVCVQHFVQEQQSSACNASIFLAFSEKPFAKAQQPSEHCNLMYTNS